MHECDSQLPAPLTDTITVLHAPHRRLAKRVKRAGEIESYDGLVRYFDLHEFDVRDLPDLAELLAGLLLMPDCAVVRGAIVDPDRTRHVRRLLTRPKDTYEEPTLREVPRSWLALDMEDIALPPDVLAADLPGCAQLALATLPTAFSNAACVVQASGSHGFKPDLRLRLWFWCNRPLIGAELKHWLRGAPADPAVFGAAQLIYTAAPVIDRGQVDPIPTRLLPLPGAPMVETPSVEELVPAPRSAEPPRVTTIHPAHVSRYIRAAYERSIERIINAGQRHPAIIAEARGLARLVHAGLANESDMRAVLRAAARAAGKQDEDEIDKCIDWGLANPSTGTLPEVRHV